jgi:hypothetical protein
MDKDGCFPFSDALEGYVKIQLKKDNPTDWLESLITEGILDEPILGKLCFTNRRSKVKEVRNMENVKEKEESVKDSSKKEDAVKDTTVSNKADASDETTTITDARDVISSSGDFSLPRLEEYLGDAPNKEAVLTSARMVSGKYGPTAILNFEGQEFRSGGEVIVDQATTLIDDGRFPFKVDVKKVTGKTGRTYYSL